MHIIRRFYEEEFDFADNGEPRKTYMVASIPRSGSTFFCTSLWRTGVLGAPMEYINLPNHGSLIDRVSKGDLKAYWPGMKQIRTSPNGIFGYKAFVQNFKLINRMSRELLSQIASDSVILFLREDKTSQAVSYARALMTGVWFSGIKDSAPPEYSFQQILRCYRWIHAQERAWEALFLRTETTPLRLSYELFLADQRGVIEQIKSFLQVNEADESLAIPTLEKQSDGLSKQWRQRFLDDLARFKMDALEAVAEVGDDEDLGPLPSTE